MTTAKHVEPDKDVNVSLALNLKKRSRHLMSSTQLKITDLLNREDLTVSELAGKLGISRNSVHLQISKLEASGVLEKYHADQQGVGKPAYRYRVVGGKEDSFSSAYKSVLSSLVQIISKTLPEKERVQILENAGRLLASESGLAPTGDLTVDTQHALAKVNQLGAMAELKQEKKQLHVRCHSCPVASVVHKDPLVCNLVAAFFSQATGQTATVQCQHDRTVICGFSFEEDS